MADENKQETQEFFIDFRDVKSNKLVQSYEAKGYSFKDLKETGLFFLRTTTDKEVFMPVDKLKIEITKKSL